VEDPEADAAYAEEMEENDRQLLEQWRHPVVMVSEVEAQGDSRRRWWKWW
jgi:hypothetical protein